MTVRSRSADLLFPAASLLKEAPGASRIQPIAEAVVDLGPDLRQASPVEGELRLARTNRGLLINAAVQTSLALECSRCLRDVEVPLELTIVEEALPSIDIATGLAVDASAEPDVIRLTASHELDLEPLLREAIQLAEPIAPLCRPDCPGMCVVCGAELAGGPHDHGDEELDPRLEVLRALQVDGERETG